MIFDEASLFRAMEDSFNKGWWESKRQSDREAALKTFLDDCRRRLHPELKPTTFVDHGEAHLNESVNKG
jgi:hypothetical protein